MPETLLLRTFLAVAAGLSFRKAAAELHVAPSTVTSRIMALEEELGVRLFARKSRSVALTGAGQRLFWHAAHLVELARRTRQVAAGERDVPEVRLRVSETLGAWCLPPVLGRFRQAYPTARVHLVTASREGMVRDVRRGGVDAALLLGEPFSAPGIVVESLGRERLVVCTGPGGPLADRTAVGPDDLADVPLVLTRRVWSARPLVERTLAGEGGVAGYVECDGSRIARRLAEAGLGVTVAPEFSVAGALRRGRLRALAWRGEPLFATVLVARDRTRTPDGAVAALLDAVRAFFHARGKQKGTVF